MYTPVMSIASLAEGESTLVRVGGVEIVLCHVDGQFYAVNARCSHAQQSLAAGRLRGYYLTCPLHGARFDIRTGACAAAPATQPIARYPVLVEGGKVCIQV